MGLLYRWVLLVFFGFFVLYSAVSQDVPQQPTKVESPHKIEHLFLTGANVSLASSNVKTPAGNPLGNLEWGIGYDVLYWGMGWSYKNIFSVGGLLGGGMTLAYPSFIFMALDLIDDPIANLGGDTDFYFPWLPVFDFKFVLPAVYFHARVPNLRISAYTFLGMAMLVSGYIGPALEDISNIGSLGFEDLLRVQFLFDLALTWELGLHFYGLTFTYGIDYVPGLIGADRRSRTTTIGGEVVTVDRTLPTVRQKIGIKYLQSNIFR